MRVAIIQILYLNKTFDDNEIIITNKSSVYMA